MAWRAVSITKRGGARGLTLVEMSLALVVLGLVAVSIMTIFGAAADLVEEGRGRMELVQGGRAAMNRLLAELRMTVAVEARSDNYLRVFCQGTTSEGSISRRVEFWAADGTLWRRVEGEAEQALAENVTGLETGGLTLWSKLDGPADVTSPQVGPAGFFGAGSAWEAVKFGNGFSSSPGSGRCVYFPTGGVLDPGTGTIEFWLKPEFSAEWPGMNQGKYLIDTGDFWGIQLFFDHAVYNIYLYVAGKTLYWRPDWAPGEVVHVAIVWDSQGREIGGGRTAALFVNGALCENSPQTGTFSPLSLGTNFSLGRSSGIEAEAAFDNLRVYDYCKTDFRDRYLEEAFGLMRVILTLEDPDAPGDTITLRGRVWLQ